MYHILVLKQTPALKGKEANNGSKLVQDGYRAVKQQMKGWICLFLLLSA